MAALLRGVAAIAAAAITISCSTAPTTDPSIRQPADAESESLADRYTKFTCTWLLAKSG